MTFWIKVLQLIVSLSLLVFVHELGHYMWAKIFKVRVEKFYLFFDLGLKKLGIKWDGSIIKYKPKKSHTQYGVGWLPLGGYCKIAGMIDESIDTEQMKRPEQPWEFRSKPAWQRLLIMIGGVLNNFLLAIIIYAGIVFCLGEQYLPYKNVEMGMSFSPSAKKLGFMDGDIPLSADGEELYALSSSDVHAMVTAKQVKVLRGGKDTVTIKIPDKYIFQVDKEAKDGISFMTYRMPVIVDSIMQGGGAEKAKLMVGDSIFRVNNVIVPDLSSLTEQLKLYKGKTVTIAFMRNGRVDSARVDVNSDAMIGIGLRPFDVIYKDKIVTKKYGLLESIPRGVVLGWTQMVHYVESLKYIFTKEGAQSVGGFGTIGSVFPDKWDWLRFWELTALLSVILAFMNILPIPALDGGHVMFLLYEIIFRRKPGEKFLLRAQVVGMVFLFALLIWANGNDIYRWITGS